MKLPRMEEIIFFYFDFFYNYNICYEKFVTHLLLYTVANVDTFFVTDVWREMLYHRLLNLPEVRIFCKFCIANMKLFCLQPEEKNIEVTFAESYQIASFWDKSRHVCRIVSNRIIVRIITSTISNLLKC